MRRLALLLACVAFARPVAAADVGFDFNQTSLPQGTSVAGTAALLTTDGFTGGSVRLVNSTQGQQGSLIVGDIANGAPVSGFTATFKLRQDNPSNPPADGWSFNFATDLPSTSFGEEGAGSGLTLSFDTFDSGGGEAPAVNARWRGVELAVARPGLATMLTGDGGTSPWADVLIRLEDDGTLDVVFDGVSIFSNLQTPYIPQVGARLGIGGRTGSFVTTIAVDDLTFSTRTSVVVFNSTKDFSVANGNPNGAWSYGFMPGNFSSFTRYTTPSTGEFAAWNTPGMCGDGTPIVFRNLTTSTRFGIAPGQVSIHPGCGGQVSSLRFTAPSAGNYTFDGRFFPGDGAAMQVGVRRGSTMLFQATDQGSFTLRDVALAAGDAVDMVVFGGYAFGNTPLDLQVTVPIGPTNELLVTAPTTAVAGSAFDVTVTPRDSGGLTDITYRGSVAFTSIDPAATLPAIYTFVESDRGTRAFPGGVTLRRAGATTFTVTDTALGTLRTVKTVDVAAAALSAAVSTMTSASGTLESDGVTTTLITVTPTDEFGNRRGAGAAVAITTTAGTLVGSVRDVGDGTYTQALRAPTTPTTATVSATVGGVALTNTASVQFVADLTPPAAVTLSLAAASAQQATLSWTTSTSTDVARYVLAIEDGAGAPLLEIDAGLSTSRLVTELPACAGVRFAVRPIDNAGNVGARSNTITLTTQRDGVPEAPSSLAAVARDGYVKLTTTASATCDVRAHRILRSTTSGSGYAVVATLPAGTLAFVDATVTNGTRFFYVAAGVDGDGNEGTRSAEVIADPLDAPPAGPVTDLVATSLPGGTIELSWLPPLLADDFVAYRVYRLATPTSSLSSTALLSEQADEGRLDLPPVDGPVHYAVTWVDLGGNESEGAFVSSTSDRLAPSATLALASTPPLPIGSHALTLRLDEAPAATPTLRYRAPNGVTTTIALTVDGADARVFRGDVAVVEGTGEGTGTFTVVARDAAGNTGTTLDAPTVAADGQRPTAIVTTTPGSPVTASAVAVTLSASELLSPPTLAFVAAGDASVTVVPLSGSGASFSGTLVVGPDTGDGEGIFAAGLQDVAGNVGDRLTAGAALVIDFNPGPTTGLDLAASTSFVATGEAFDVVVTARDGLGRVDSSYRGTLAFSSTDPTATVPAAATFAAPDAGTRTFAGGVVLRRPGPQTITAADTATTTLRRSVAVTVATGPLSAAVSTVTSSSSSLEANGVDTTTITVVPTDAFGNRVGPGRAVAVTSTAGTVGGVDDVGDGSYRAVLVAPLVAGTALVTATVDGVALDASASVSLRPDVTAPQPPSALVVTAVRGESVDVAFVPSASAEATQTVLEVRDAAGAVLRTVNAEATSTFTVLGLSSCTRFGLSAFSLDAAGNRSTSTTTVSVRTVLDGAPAAPADLAVTARDGYARVRFSGSGSCDVVANRLLRSEVAGGPYTLVREFAADGVTGELALLDVALDNGRTYFWIAVAVDVEGLASAPSNEVAATPLDGPPSAAVPLLAGEALPGGRVELSWLPPLDADRVRYAVYRSVDPIGDVRAPGVTLVTEQTGERYAELPPSDGQWFYTVTWYDVVDAESAPALPVAVVADRVAPRGTVTVSGATPHGIGRHTVTLTLDEDAAPSAPPELRFRAPGASAATTVFLAATAPDDRRAFVGTIDVAEGTPEAEGAFTLVVTDVVGNVGTSIAAGAGVVVDGVRPTATVATVPAALVPEGTVVVTLVSREPLSTEPRLTVTPSAGTSTDIPLLAQGGDGARFVGSFLVTAATAAGTARFTTALVDRAGNAGAVLTAGDTVVIDPVPPGAPTALTAAVGALGRITLSWRAPVSDADARYVVYRAPTTFSSTAGLAPAQDGVTTTSTTDLPPADGRWFYAVAARDRAGNLGPPSTTIEVVSDQTPPGAPTGLQAVQEDAFVRLSWTPPVGEAAATYAVYRTSSSTGGSVNGLAPALSGLRATSVSDRPTTEGRYFYVVVALDQVGLTSAASNEVAVLYDFQPPSITVAGVADGEHVNRAVAPLVSFVDVNLASTELTLDGAPFVSGTSVGGEGAHTLAASATDLGGRSSSRTVRFTIDLTAPVVTVQGIDEGAHYETPPTATFGATDANLASVVGTLDGAPFTSGSRILSDGAHTLVVTARDRAGNAALRTVRFTVDLPPATPRGLRAVLDDNVALSWAASPEGDVVGYRVVRDGVELAASTSSTQLGGGPRPTAPQRARFEVQAVDRAGHRSSARTVVVTDARIALVSLGGDDGDGGETLTRGFYDDLVMQVVNADPASLSVAGVRSELFDNEGVRWWTGTSTASAVAPGSSATGAGAAVLDAAVFAHPELDPQGDLLDVVVDVVGADPEARVGLRGRFTTAWRFAPSPPLVAVHGALVRGAEASIAMRVTNLGSESMDLLTDGPGASPSPDLEVRLEHPDGRVLARASIDETVVGGSRAADGNFVTTLSPGETRTFQPVRLVIPGDAPDNVNLVLDVKRVHHRYGRGDALRETGFSFVDGRSVVPPPYVSTAVAARSEYQQGEVVLLSGVATETVTGAPATQSTVKVVLSNDGFERMLFPRTNDQGVWSVDVVLGGEVAGLFSVSATHPTVLAREQDATFVVHGLKLEPTVLPLSLVRGTSFSVGLGLRNTGDTPLSGLAVALTDGDGVATVIDGVSAATGALPTTLAPNQAVSIPVTIAATSDAADTAAFVVTVTNTQGATRTARIVVSTFGAQPSIVPSPAYLEASLRAGSSLTRTVTLENRGFGTWRNARVTAPTDVPWIVLPTGNVLGDVPPGGRVSFDVLLVPPASEPSRLVQTSLRVTSDNFPERNYAVQANLTAAADGVVEVQVTNLIYALTAPDTPVPGARVRLQSQENFAIFFEGNADLLGRLTFPVVPAGRYSTFVDAPGFRPADRGVGAEDGTVIVEAGATSVLSVALVESFVDVDFTVDPVTVNDQYDLVVNATFATQVPVPVVITSPQIQHFDLQPGSIRTGQFEVQNLGLVQADNVTFAITQDHYLDVQLQFDRIDVLPAQSSVIVPFTILLKTHASPPPPLCHEFSVTIEPKYEWFCSTAGVPVREQGMALNLSVRSHEARVVVEPPVVHRPTYINCGSDFVSQPPASVSMTNLDGGDVGVCDCGRVTSRGLSIPVLQDLVDALKDGADGKFDTLCKLVAERLSLPGCSTLNADNDAAGVDEFGPEDWPNMKDTLGKLKDLAEKADDARQKLEDMNEACGGGGAGGGAGGSGGLGGGAQDADAAIAALSLFVEDVAMNAILERFTGGILEFKNSLNHFEETCLGGGQSSSASLGSGAVLGLGYAEFNVQKGCGSSAPCCPVTVPFVDTTVVCGSGGVSYSSEGWSGSRSVRCNFCGSGGTCTR